MGKGREGRREAESEEERNEEKVGREEVEKKERRKEMFLHELSKHWEHF